ncbi:MAG: hypothetical protein NZ694_02250 [Tepidimonas sp.]|nr:hypothetical protein [Tepidimonas sp.]MCX7692683.1 hypothetical protein [Tepidimonas taiwanensis]
MPSDWQTAARAYQRHHWACPTCASAGRGHGDRCPEGARLWAAYTAQPGSASRRPERQPLDAHADPTPHPYAKERVRWWPADGREIERMAATFERARALGFAPEEADRLAEVAHWAARLTPPHGWPSRTPAASSIW